MEEKLSDVENEWYQASEEMRKLMTIRRNVELEVLRVRDTVYVDVERTVVEARSSEGETGLIETLSDSRGDHAFRCSDGGQQKKGKVVRKESAETQDYVSCHMMTWK